MNEHHFEFDECIGTGGFGVVYRARMTTTNGLVRVVAVKALRPDAASPGAVARLRDEARLLAALQHRAILAVHDLVRLDGRIALVSEYVEGADLAQLIEEGEVPVVPARAAVQIVGEVAGALAAAWSSPAPKTGTPMNLVHRDIKPANIRVSKAGAVKLLDFGIAKSDSVERHANTGTGLLAGTFGYLAPDRLTEEGARPSADVYALGLVLYEVLSGHRLYRDCTRHQTLRMAIDAEAHDAFVEAGMARLSDVPLEVRELVRDMLRFHADTRPSAAEVEARAEDLSDSLEGPSVRRWARSHTWGPSRGASDAMVGRTITASGLLDQRILQQLDGEALPASAVGVTWVGDGLSVPSIARPGAEKRSPRLWGVALGVVAAVVAALAMGALTEAPTAPPPASESPEQQLVHDDMPKGGAESRPRTVEGPEVPDKKVVVEAPVETVEEVHTVKTTPPDVDPEPEVVGVAVTLGSVPMGATVRIGGDEVCAVTPCNVALPPGEHKVQFRLTDGRVGTELITVDGSEKQRFGHRFAPK